MRIIFSSRNYSNYLRAQKPQAEEPVSPKEKSYNPLEADKKQSEAAFATLGENYFRLKLQQHIRDHQRGEGYRSSSFYQQLGKKSFANSQALAHTNPDALALYSGLTTAMGYDKQARMVTSVSQSIAGANAINNVIAESEEQ